MGQNGPKSSPKQRKYSENAAKTCDSCGTPDISPHILRLKPENYIRVIISLIQVRNIQKLYSYEDDLLVEYTKSFFLKMTLII